MADQPLTEAQDVTLQDLDSRSTLDLVTAMNQADAGITDAVARELPRIALAVDAISAALDAGGCLYYAGAGTSGRLGVLDAAECPPTFGVPPDLVRAFIAGGDGALRKSAEGAEDDPEAGSGDLMAAGFASRDVLVGIAASGRTPYVLGAIAQARKIGAITCGISCTPDSELSRAVDFPIEPKTGPEVIAGSTRLRAGTATKMVLNILSTAVMVKLGHVYGNLMVNVQPTNRKLRDRARRIVEQAAGVSPERAAELLEMAGDSARTAIVMEIRKIGRVEAERLLGAAHGRIREALRIPAGK